jgi:flagellar export protein FliJ
VSAFRFRLDPVLDHRARTERERAAEHARKVADLRDAERMRDDLVCRRDTLRRDISERHNELGLDRLRATYAHLDYLDRALRAADERVVACAAETARSQARLVEAARERQVLETLKDRRREAFELEAALVQQREVDDLNARLFERAHPLEGYTS